MIACAHAYDPNAAAMQIVHRIKQFSDLSQSFYSCIVRALFFSWNKMDDNEEDTDWDESMPSIPTNVFVHTVHELGDYQSLLSCFRDLRIEKALPMMEIFASAESTIGCNESMGLRAMLDSLDFVENIDEMEHVLSLLDAKLCDRERLNEICAASLMHLRHFVTMTGVSTFSSLMDQIERIVPSNPNWESKRKIPPKCLSISRLAPSLPPECHVNIGMYLTKLAKEEGNIQTFTEWLNYALMIIDHSPSIRASMRNISALNIPLSIFSKNQMRSASLELDEPSRLLQFVLNPADTHLIPFFNSLVEGSDENPYILSSISDFAFFYPVELVTGLVQQSIIATDRQEIFANLISSISSSLDKSMLLDIIKGSLSGAPKSLAGCVVLLMSRDLLSVNDVMFSICMPALTQREPVYVALSILYDIRNNKDLRLSVDMLLVLCRLRQRVREENEWVHVEVCTDLITKFTDYFCGTIRSFEEYVDIKESIGWQEIVLISPIFDPNVVKYSDFMPNSPDLTTNLQLLTQCGVSTDLLPDTDITGIVQASITVLSTCSDKEAMVLIVNILPWLLKEEGVIGVLETALKRIWESPEVLEIVKITKRSKTVARLTVLIASGLKQIVHDQAGSLDLISNTYQASINVLNTLLCIDSSAFWKNCAIQASKYVQSLSMDCLVQLELHFSGFLEGQKDELSVVLNNMNKRTELLSIRTPLNRKIQSLIGRLGT